MRAAMVDTSKVAAAGAGPDVSNNGARGRDQSGGEPQGKAFGFFGLSPQDAKPKNQPGIGGSATSGPGNSGANNSGGVSNLGNKPSGNAYGLNAGVDNIGTLLPRPAEADAASVIQASLERSDTASLLSAEEAARARAVAAMDRQKMEQLVDTLKEVSAQYETSLGDADGVGPTTEDVGKLPV